MRDLEIRFAAAVDLAEVIEIERRTRQAPHWEEGEYRSILNSREGPDGVRRCFFIAQTAERFAGFAVGRATGQGVKGFAELESVVVEVGFRRRGVGIALCEAVIVWCRELGVGTLELEVRAGSSGAIALYRKLKFAVVGSRHAYYRDPEEDAVLMRLGL